MRYSDITSEGKSRTYADNALASKNSAAISAGNAAASATGASLSYYSFGTLSALNSFLGASVNQSATVWGDTDSNNGIYHWNGSAWVRDADNLGQVVSTLTSVLTMQPTGDGSSIVFMNTAGYGIGRLNVNVLEAPTVNGLVKDVSTVVDLPNGFGMWPTGGTPLVLNQIGYAVSVLNGTSSSSTVSNPTDTAGRVAAVLDTQVEDAPLIPGKNISFTWGESKADSFGYQYLAFNQIYAARVGTLPVGTTVASSVYFHNAYTVNELIADVASMRTVMDGAFTGGAEDISFITMNEMANDMIGGTPPAVWEASMDHAMDLIQRYALQKYVGTDSTKPVPVPPVFMTLDCTWAVGNLPIGIPLLAIEKAKRDYRFGIAVPDYVADFALTPTPDYRHYSGNDKRLLSAYHGLAWFYWRYLKKKYAPTQVIEWWLQDSDFYLRCKMPHAPLVADTALVSSIANNGLIAYTSSNIPTMIADLTIVGGGTIIKGTTLDSLVGGRIEGGLTPTTSGRSGKVDGPRLTYRDSSPYMFNNGSVDINLYSPMLPFRVRF